MKSTKSIFHNFVKTKSASNQLVVQPRMGFSDFSQMRGGLERVKAVDAATIGTITLDSFTRTGDFKSARAAIVNNNPLNGYPIVSYGQAKNRELIRGLIDIDFPIQVRHGCPTPEAIFKSIVEAGIDASEGGPISYCFPYSRTPLETSVASWRKCSEIFAEIEDIDCHIESFGGCMMGQLCPPSLLIAISVVEALFFKTYGVRSYSLSLSQGTHFTQDVAALNALTKAANKYLGESDEWHIVFYTFMGKFPQTVPGARALMADSIRIAKAGGAARLIVKTEQEAIQIPTVEDNIEALKQADRIYSAEEELVDLEADMLEELTRQIFDEADFLIDLLLNLDNDIAKAITLAFDKGYWDIPFCLHPQNNNKTTAKLNGNGTIRWARTGKIPFPENIRKYSLIGGEISSRQLIEMLSYNQMKYDTLNYSPQSYQMAPIN